MRLLGAVLLLVLAGVSLDSLSPTLLLGGSITVAVALAKWWIAAGPRVIALPHWSILLPAAGLFLLQSVSLFWTPFPGPAFSSLVETLLIASIALMVLNTIQHGWEPRNWHEAVILLGVALTILELILFVGWVHSWRAIEGVQTWLPPTGYRSSGLLLGHPNVLAGLINFALPLLLVRAIHHRSNKTGWLLTLPITILLFGLFLTSSRAGWLSGFIGLLVTLVLMLMAASDHQVGRLLSQLASAVRFWHVAAGAVLVLLVGVAALWQVSRTGHQPLAGARTPVWAASLEIIRQEPITGHGLRSYPVSYARLPFEHHEEDIPHAHNLILQIGVETGLAGLALLFALVWGLGRVAWRAWLAADRSERVALAAYGGASAAAFSHAMFDYLFGPAMYAAAGAFLLGSLLGTIPESGTVTWNRGRWPRLIVAPGPLAAACLMLLPLKGSWDAWTGALEARDNRWEAASRHLCSAHELNPADSVAASSCGLAVQIAAFEDASGLIGSQALQALKAAASLDPAWGLHSGNWGAGELAAGDYSQAAQALDDALSVYPVSTDSLLTRGLAAERMEGPQAAGTYYRSALEINPWTYHSAYLQAEPWRLDGIDPNHLGEKFTEAERLVWQARMALDQGNLEAAQSAIQLAEKSGARNFRLPALRAEIALLEGDQELALYYARVAVFMAPNHPVTREVLALILAAQQSPLAGQEIVRAAESLVFGNSSLRYFFSAHGKLGLPTDRSPDLILGGVTARLVNMAHAVLNGENGEELLERERLVLELLIRHCGCEPELDELARRE